MFQSRTLTTTGRLTIWVASLLFTSLIFICPSVARAQKLQPFSTSGLESLPPPWRAVGLPNAKTPLTRLDVVSIDGMRVLRLTSDKSYGNALHELVPVVPGQGSLLRWQWRLDQPLMAADLRTKGGDDAALKVCLLFDMPLEKLGVLERNVFSPRLRFIVLDSGENNWGSGLPTSGTSLPISGVPLGTKPTPHRHSLALQ